MNEVEEEYIVPIERIAERIYLIRDQKVMIDSDLAKLYGVETGALVRATKRNKERFPDDFMFQLKQEEFENLKCQTGISSRWGGRRSPPYAFTEHGVLMLSSVLRSERAAQVNISIIRAFVCLRQMLATHKDVARKIAEHDRQIANLYEHVQRLLNQPDNGDKPIGYIWPDDK